MVTRSVLQNTYERMYDLMQKGTVIILTRDIPLCYSLNRQTDFDKSLHTTKFYYVVSFLLGKSPASVY